MSLQRNPPTTKATASPSRASILLLSQRSPQTARVDLQRMVRDVQVDLRQRTVAITGLARIADASVVADLEALVDAEEPIAQVALRTLGRRGTPNSIAALQRAMAGKPSRANRVAAGFAAALIAHRFNLPGHDLSPPDRATILPWRAADSRVMKFHEADPGEVGRLRASMNADAPGLALAKRAWHIECRGRHSLFALTAELADTWDPAAFTRRKLHVGQVALENLSNGNFSPGLTVLTDPDGAGGCIIGVYRSAGTLVMAGRGKPVGKRIDLQLGTVERIAAFPMDLHIVVGPDALDVITANVGPGSPRNHPTPMAR